MLKELLNKLFFLNAAPMVKIARSRYIGEEDLPELPDEWQLNDLKSAEAKIPLNGVSQFLKGIVSFPKKLRRKLIILSAVGLIAQIFSPLLIEILIKNIQELSNSSPFMLISAFWGMVFVIVSLLHSLSVQHYFYNALTVTQMTVNVLNQMIYDKTLRLSLRAKQRRQVGDTINLLGTDSDTVAEYLWVLIELIQSIVLLFVSLILLGKYLGLGALASFFTLIVISPLTKKIGQEFVRLDDSLMQLRDQRVTLMSQILNGIRVIKYFVWEKKALDDLNHVRRKELSCRMELIKVETASILLYLASSVLLSVVGFYTFWLLGGTLSAEIVFPCLAIMAAMEHPFGNLTDLIAHLANARVSARRLVDFLTEEENTTQHKVVSQQSELIKVANLSCGSERKILEDLNFSIRKGEKVAIVGEVGSGKSVLLQTLLGEFPITSGGISIPKELKKMNLAWVPQSPFIINGNLRDNILFGHSDDFLGRAIHSSQLIADINSLQDGLDTVIGENGVNLSGGQKQRVGLARAVLVNPDIVLLDDPMSALDESTELLIMDQLIQNEWKEKTLIMATHRLKHLESFDRILFLQNKKILMDGDYQNLFDHCLPFREFIEAAHRDAHQISQPHRDAFGSKTEIIGSGQWVEEDKEVGHVKGAVFLAYFASLVGKGNAVKKIYSAAALMFTIAMVISLPVLQNGWLAVWFDQKFSGGNRHFLHVIFSQFIGSEEFNLAVFALIGLGILIAFYGQHLLWATRSMHAAEILLQKAMKSVLHTPIRFFDTNPIGRILNRFSNDHDMVEKHLPWAFDHTIRSGVRTLMLLLILVGIFPLVSVVFMPVLIVFYFLQKDFRSVGRETKRFSSLARSPRFAHYKQTFEGIAVIRAFGKVEGTKVQFQEKLRHYQKMFHGQVVLNRWFSARLPLLGAVLTFAVIVLMLYSSKQGVIAAGTIGFVLVTSISLWGHLNWCIRSYSEAESRLIGVERLKSYGDLAEEDSTLVEPVIPSMQWPNKGQIVFEQVFARYSSDLPFTLRDVSFKIESNQNVGIIGRTGAGKSTIIQTLFRFAEIVSGQIVIDGHDIRSIPLPLLRRKIAIIPQEPTLFVGSLRSNLDRYGEHTDQEIFDSLQSVYLRDWIRDSGGLDMEIDENGDNLSGGQKQLLCMARAMLLKAKIIVLDEATAHVDPVTDQKIQQFLERACKNKTVVIIAHRLSTLKNCDQIIELSSGRVTRVFKPGDASGLEDDIKGCDELLPA